MKKNYLSSWRPHHIFYMVMALFATISCGEAEEVVDDLIDDHLDKEITITTENNKLTFEATETLSQTIEIEASEKWALLNTDDDTIYAYADWVSEVTPSSADGNSEVAITLKENQSVNKRETSLYFGIKKSNGEHQLLKIDIEQKPNDATMSIDRYVIWFMEDSANPDDLTQELTITTNDKWSISAEGEIPDWLTLSATEGEGDATISITVAVPTEPSETYDRSVDLLITNKDIEGFEPRMVSVSQFTLTAHHISSPDLTDGIIKVEQDGTSSPFRLITSHPWHFHAIDGTDQDGYPAWITPSPLSGIANDTVRLVCTPNNTLTTRKTTFCIGLETTTVGVHYYKNIHVEQEGVDASITFSPKSMEFVAAGAENSLSVTSNDNWYISSDSPYLTADDKWLTLSKEADAEGTSGESITLTATEQKSFENRSTQVYFKLKTYPDMEPIVYTITQKEKALADAVFTTDLTDGGSIEFNASSSSSQTKNIEIISELPWRIMSTKSGDDSIYEHKPWISTSNSSGEGNTTLRITITNNQFKSERNTYIYLKQEGSDKILNIPIVQQSNTDSKMTDYGNLGYGYDSSGLIADQKMVRSQVLDCDKLEGLGVINKINYPNESVTTSEIFESVDKLQTALNINAGITGGYSGFTAEIDTKYGTSLAKFKETKFATKSVVYRKAIINTDSNITLDQIKQCVLPSVQADIDGTTGLSADEVITKYGSHVILSYVLGGKFEYCTSAVRSSSDSDTNFGASVAAAYDDGLNKVGGSFGSDYASKVSSSSFESKETYTTRGGGAYSTATDWAKSLEIFDNLTMIEFICNQNCKGVYPVYELATDTSRREELKTRAESKTEELSAKEVQGIYKYAFWISKIYPYIDDPGNCEMNLTFKSLKTAKKAAHKDEDRKTIWSFYAEDVPDDYASTGNYADLYPGMNGFYSHENMVGSNLYVTDEIFTGGSSSTEISLSLSLGEGDMGWDQFTGYLNFRTKEGYNKADSDGDPFWYKYSEDASSQMYPFENIDNGGGWYDSTWWSETLVSDSSISYNNMFNGYVYQKSGTGGWAFTVCYKEVTD